MSVLCEIVPIESKRMPVRCSAAFKRLAVTLTLRCERLQLSNVIVPLLLLISTNTLSFA